MQEARQHVHGRARPCVVSVAYLSAVRILVVEVCKLFLRREEVPQQRSDLHRQLCPELVSKTAMFPPDSPPAAPLVSSTNDRVVGGMPPRLRDRPDMEGTVLIKLWPDLEPSRAALQPPLSVEACGAAARVFVLKMI